MRWDFFSKMLSQTFSDPTSYPCIGMDRSGNDGEDEVRGAAGNPASDLEKMYFYQYETTFCRDKFSFLKTIYEIYMPQFETEHKGHAIKITSTIANGGKYRWAVLIDGVLLQSPVVEPSDTWEAARDQGMTFAKDFIHTGK